MCVCVCVCVCECECECVSDMFIMHMYTASGSMYTSIV